MSDWPKQRMLKVAQDVLGGAIPIVDGIREFVSLGYAEGYGWEDDDFAVLYGFETNIEEYPSSAARQLWTTEGLRKMDEWALPYIENSTPEVLQALRNMVLKVSRPEPTVVDISVGQVGEIVSGDQEGRYVRIEAGPENSGGFRVLTAASANMEGCDTTLVSNETALKNLFGQSQWQVRWLR